MVRFALFRCPVKDLRGRGLKWPMLADPVPCLPTRANEMGKSVQGAILRTISCLTKAVDSLRETFMLHPISPFFLAVSQDAAMRDSRSNPQEGLLDVYVDQRRNSRVDHLEQTQLAGSLCSQ